MDALKIIAQDSLKAEVPEIKIGNTVRVHVNIREGERERIQVFEGIVIAKNGSGVSETFTVRRISYGTGIERVFPLHSPNVVKVEKMIYDQLGIDLGYLPNMNSLVRSIVKLKDEKEGVHHE